MDIRKAKRQKRVTSHEGGFVAVLLNLTQQHKNMPGTVKEKPKIYSIESSRENNSSPNK